MFSAEHTIPSPGNRPSRDACQAVVALTVQRLAELDRLREAGLAQAERLVGLAENLSPLEEYRRMTGPKGTIQEYDRVAKAVRQVVVLEFELRGLFKAPDRDVDFTPRLAKENLLGDLYDYDDYSDLFDFAKARRSLLDLTNLRVKLDYNEGPLDALIADIRKTLGVEAPVDDPFAGPSLLRDRIDELFNSRSRSAGRSSVDRSSNEKPRPPAMQIRPVVKQAAPALPRKGFRVPPSSPHNPKTQSGEGKHRRNRGPPR